MWILIVACLLTANNLRQFAVFSYWGLFKDKGILKQVRFLPMISAKFQTYGFLF